MWMLFAVATQVVAHVILQHNAISLKNTKNVTGRLTAHVLDFADGIMSSPAPLLGAHERRKMKSRYLVLLSIFLMAIGFGIASPQISEGVL